MSALCRAGRGARQTEKERRGKEVCREKTGVEFLERKE